MTCYIGIAVYVVNIVAWKTIHGTKRVTPRAMDLDTDRRHFEEVERAEAADLRTTKRIWPDQLRRRQL